MIVLLLLDFPLALIPISPYLIYNSNVPVGLCYYLQRQVIKMLQCYQPLTALAFPIMAHLDTGKEVSSMLLMPSVSKYRLWIKTHLVAKYFPLSQRKASGLYQSMVYPVSFTEGVRKDRLLLTSSLCTICSFWEFPAPLCLLCVTFCT